MTLRYYLSYVIQIELMYFLTVPVPIIIIIIVISNFDFFPLFFLFYIFNTTGILIILFIECIFVYSVLENI